MLCGIVPRGLPVAIAMIMPFSIAFSSADLTAGARAVSYTHLDVYKRQGKKCLINIANAGKFSSDRAIVEYAKDIWHTSYRKV